MPVEQIDDPSVRIKPSSILIDFVKHNVTCKSMPECFQAIKKSHNDSDTLLKIDDVKWLNNYLVLYRQKSKKKVYIHELLEGIDLILPTPKVTPRNPILEARVQKLQAQQDARDYAAMTKGVDVVRKRLPEDTLAYQMKEINNHLIAVAQFVFSVIAGFVFGFVGIELSVGTLDFGFKLLLGIICALIVALAEIYFLAKKLNEDLSEPLQQATYRKPHQE